MKNVKKNEDMYQNIYDLLFLPDTKTTLQEMVIECKASGLTALSYMQGVYEAVPVKRKDDSVDKFVSRIKNRMNAYGLTFSGKAVKPKAKKKKVAVQVETTADIEDMAMAANNDLDVTQFLAMVETSTDKAFIGKIEKALKGNALSVLFIK